LMLDVLLLILDILCFYMLDIQNCDVVFENYMLDKKLKMPYHLKS